MPCMCGRGPPQTPTAPAPPGSSSYSPQPTSLRLLQTPSPPTGPPPANPPSCPAAPKQLAILYYQKGQEERSLKGELEDLRDNLLMDIRKLKAQIREEEEATQSRARAIRALYELRAQAKRDCGEGPSGDAGERPPWGP